MSHFCLIQTHYTGINLLCQIYSISVMHSIFCRRLLFIYNNGSLNYKSEYYTILKAFPQCHLLCSHIIIQNNFQLQRFCGEDFCICTHKICLFPFAQAEHWCVSWSHGPLIVAHPPRSQLTTQTRTPARMWCTPSPESTCTSSTSCQKMMSTMWSKVSIMGRV